MSTFGGFNAVFFKHALNAGKPRSLSSVRNRLGATASQSPDSSRRRALRKPFSFRSGIVQTARRMLLMRGIELRKINVAKNAQRSEW
jgi:hypothetical protein